MTELEYVEKEIENVKDLIKETENCSEYTSYMKENIIKDHNLTIATLNSIKKKLEAFEILSRAIEFVDEGDFQSGHLNRVIFNDMVDDKEKSILDKAFKGDK